MASSFLRRTYLAQFFSRVSTPRYAFCMNGLGNTRSTLHSLRKENASQKLFFCHSRDQQDALWKASAKLYCTQASQVFVTIPPQPLTSTASPADPGKNDFKKLTNVEVDTEKKQLLVSWEGGAESQAFPFVWLRDNCHCPDCFHPTALGRLPSAQIVEVDVVADSAELSSDGTKLIVQWDDSHKSQFTTDWLRYYRFDKSPDDQLFNPEMIFLGADVFPKCFDFGEVLTDDQVLYGWLNEVMARGIAVVKNAPAELGQLHKLAGRVAYLRSTIYGVTCQVKSKDDPNSVGYTSGALALHTDYAYYMHEPGFVMLHCIEHSKGEGGENLISDGFKVAMDLKEIDPEAFRLLTTYQFEYSDKGTDHFGRFYLHGRHPVIRLNERGNIEAIILSNHSRDPMLRVPVDQVLPIYRALDKYFKMLQQPENVLKYKMQKGDILTFNNKRMLHGRSSFKLIENGNRHLELGYLEWDEIYSRLRALAMTFGNPTNK
ncbi:gamma-butyrobetaine dioxygenase-like isoform X2 [Acanthaster planci]|nr:gamma-butyrobetaine dioxygenase-like isoform X2 [Acanthaster planci]XP_022089274.1 gamma-butyrobetaine dioxygenase-like isoform X2 [Acanthaster planci]XP_022089276.1 gamma-butyrobetaine dioxygenase-like isoform X2 [Acanthaster planci]